MTYELHPLCTLFPRLSGHEFESLCADIKENGLRQPIVIHDGMILDGGNRYLACIDSGIEPDFIEFGGENIVSFVLSANLHRRHLSPGQQAAIVSSAQDWAKAQTVGKPKSGNVTGLEKVEDRMAKSGASDKTQRMADKVAKSNPELAKKVGHGEISLPKAVKQISPPKQMNEECEKDREEIQQELYGNEEVDVLAELEDAHKEIERLHKIIECNDHLIEIKRLSDLLLVTESQRDAFQASVSDLKRQVKYWKSKLEKLEKQVNKADLVNF